MNANIQLKNDTIDEYTKNPAIISRIKSFSKAGQFQPPNIKSSKFQVSALTLQRLSFNIQR
jgi:hypothetical protein